MASRRWVGLFLFFTVIVLPSCAPSCSGCSGSGCSGSACSWSPPRCSCAPDDRSSPDASRGLDAYRPPDAVEGPRDAPRDVRGVVDEGRSSCGGRGQVGGQCVAAECFAPALCQEEVVGERPSVRRDSEGPGRPYPVDVFPGGICELGCRPDAPSLGACDECTTCIRWGLDEWGEAYGSCMLRCVQDLDGRGGCNEGYGCNRADLVCMPACTRTATTDTCQYTFEDRDTDPTTRETIVDEGVDHPSVCNVVTGLCETTGRTDASAGDDCSTAFDCENDGECVRSSPSDPPSTLSDGYCVRHGCNETDLACRDGDVCSRTVFNRPGGTCMQGCVVGAETDEAQRLGSGGGHPGCGAGEACSWDGVHGTTDARNGACFPGNYNDVPAYNVGAECQSDAECWSPFGLGRCLFADGELHDRTGRGICVVEGCGVVVTGELGLAVSDGIVPVPRPEDLCRTATAGGTDLCVGLAERETACVATCATAEDCPTGYACPDLNDDPLRELRLCWPACTRDADCRPGARCRDTSGATCDPDVDTCTCSDAVPAPDAGGSDAAIEPDAAVEDAGDAAPDTDAGADLDAP